MGRKSDLELTLIHATTSIEGSLTSEVACRIEGELKGTIICHDRIVIGETGKVEGTIEAEIVIIEGTVHGTILGKQRIHMVSTARVHGDIYTQQLIIEEGAHFEGHCTMNAIPQHLNALQTEQTSHTSPNHKQQEQKTTTTQPTQPIEQRAAA